MAITGDGCKKTRRPDAKRSDFIELAGSDSEWTASKKDKKAKSKSSFSSRSYKMSDKDFIKYAERVIVEYEKLMVIIQNKLFAQFSAAHDEVFGAGNKIDFSSIKKAICFEKLFRLLSFLDELIEKTILRRLVLPSDAFDGTSLSRLSIMKRRKA